MPVAQRGRDRAQLVVGKIGETPVDTALGAAQQREAARQQLGQQVVQLQLRLVAACRAQ